MENFKQKLTRIKTFLFDVDGVITDGKVLIMPNGEVVRNLNTKDGFAIQLAVKKGYRIGIITGGNSPSMKQALENLGVQDVFLMQYDKLSCYKDYIATYDLIEDEILYMGDDLPDYEVMSRVGLPVCPANSAPEIKNICLYISSRNGGEGCVRDVIEQTMRAQGTWEIAGW
jgi:3-deoxy-D-manno-octulosonate 8-phosphate phosphatase (KDO 8-P phosphatase)